MVKLKISCIIFVVEIFRFDSFAVRRFPFLETVICDAQFFHDLRRISQFGNTFPRCFDVSRFVSHMRDENFFFLVLMFAIDFSLKSSRIFCTFSWFFGSFVVSDSLFDLLAEVSHLGLVFSVHFSIMAKSSWSLLSIDSSLCAAVIAVCCCSASPAKSSLCFRRCHVLLLLCFTSLFISVRCRRRRVLLIRYFRFLVCCCRRRRCRVLPLKKVCLLVCYHIFTRPVFLDGLGFFRFSTDADCLVYLVCLWRFCVFFNAWESKVRNNRSVVISAVNYVVCRYSISGDLGRKCEHKRSA